MLPRVALPSVLLPPLLLPCVLLFFVAGLSLSPLAESDVFFRLKLGQEILAQGAVPTRNLLSFTYPDHPDLDLAWLFEVLAAVLFRWGGFPALVVAKTAVLLAAFAIAYRVCRRQGAGPVAAVVALAAAALVMRERMVERPHLFSFLGEVSLLALLQRLEPGPRLPFRWRRWVAVAAAAFALVALWANLHAGAFVAPMLLALFAAGAWLDGRRGPADRAPAPWPPPALAGLALVALVALTATPAGVGIFRYLWLHITLPRLHPVDEFRAPTLVSDGPLLLFALLALAAGVTLRRRAPFRVLLPALGPALLAWQSVRFGADFALLAAPVLASAASLVFARAVSAARPLAGLARAAGPLVALGLLLATVAPRARAAAGGAPFLRLDLDTTALPLDAIAFVERHGLRRRMYNDFEIGSYLAFEGYPRHQVFVDPRLPSYPEEFHRLLGRADLTRQEWDAAMSRYQVDSALLAYAGVNRRVAWWDPRTWALVYRQHDARVFVRRAPERRDFIARHEVPATFRFSAGGGAVTVPLAKPPATSPVPPCIWQQRLGDLLFELGTDDPASAGQAELAYRRALAAPAGCLEAPDERRLAAWLGAVDLRAGRWADALALLERALLRHPAGGDLQTLANRAIALEALGENAAASSAWGLVVARAGGTPLGEKAAQRRTQTAAAAAAAAAGPLSSPSGTRPTRR